MPNSITTMGAEKKWLFTLFSGALIFFMVFISSIFDFSASSYSFTSDNKPFTSTNSGYPPAFAYYITGGKDDVDKIFRLLLAVYHPRNRYLLHLIYDGSGLDEERRRLSGLVGSVAVIREFENVDVVGKSDPATYMGATNIAAVLHAAAILLKVEGGWDWFITLSAMDYPLITQDDLSHAFSSVSKDLNFIDHSSDLGWKGDQRIRPIVVDPGIYLARRTQIFHATEKRPMPDAFTVFTGSPWVILSRSFLEYCVFGWDNLPRTLLMYVNNVVLSQEFYFHTLICNAPEFKNTTINTDLRYMVWDNPPKMEPQFLDKSNYDQMAQSGAAFARQFHKDDAVLDMIDKKILKRGYNRVALGGWCTGTMSWFTDPCSRWGHDFSVLKLGSRFKKFEMALNDLVQDSKSKQCK